MTPKIKALKAVTRVLLTGVLWIIIMDMIVSLFCIFFEIEQGAFVRALGSFNAFFVGFFYFGDAFKHIYETYKADTAAATLNQPEDGGGPDNAA